MLTPSGLNHIFSLHPRVVAAFQPWAEISQRLRRIYQIDLGPQILPVRRIIQILGGAVA